MLFAIDPEVSSVAVGAELLVSITRYARVESQETKLGQRPVPLPVGFLTNQQPLSFRLYPFSNAIRLTSII